MTPAALFAVLAAQCLAGEAWFETRSPHFVVHHETRMAPSRYLAGLENIHSKLRMDLAAFCPWMEKEPLTVYLYADQRSYARGEFKPPRWSGGMSVFDKRIVVTYDPSGDGNRFLQVVSHEFAHLFFGSFWAQEDRRPPIWLNEGVAMLAETSATGPTESSSWFTALSSWPRRNFLPLDRFVRLHPAVDYRGLREDDERVQGWYIQAFSLTYYLAREHTRLQFKNFCALLRDGRSIDAALQSAYRIRGLRGLDAEWQRWLGAPKTRRSFTPIRPTFQRSGAGGPGS